MAVMVRVTHYSVNRGPQNFGLFVLYPSSVMHLKDTDDHEFMQLTLNHNGEIEVSTFANPSPPELASGS